MLTKFDSLIKTIISLCNCLHFVCLYKYGHILLHTKYDGYVFLPITHRVSTTMPQIRVQCLETIRIQVIITYLFDSE